MKKSLVILALVAACGLAHAQSRSTSESNSNAAAYGGGGGSSSAGASIGDTVAVSGPSSAANGDQHTNVNIVQEASRIPENTKLTLKSAPSISAPHLAAVAPFSCLGSASAGLTLVGGGIMGGSTKEDPRCDAREDAKLLSALAMPEVSVARLCQIGDIRQAMEDAGRKCPGTTTIVPRNAKLEEQTRRDPQGGLGTMGPSGTIVR
jgi:hypothetical protein